MKIDTKALIENICSLKRKPANVNAEEEVEYLRSLFLTDEVSSRFENYENAVIVGVGGSGLILRATYTPSGVDRAIKFPRKRQYDNSKLVPDVDPERAALEKVSHQNITRLYDAFQLPGSGSYCVITQFIPGDDNSLDSYVIKLVCNDACRKSDEQLTLSLKRLAKIIYDISGALLYLHREAKLLHFDIKPENLLVTPEGVPFVTDLGFARELKEYKNDETVEVGFTWKYAHKRLQDPHLGARVTNVPQKSKKPLKGEELSPIFDVFAFGRTLQEVLAIVFLEFGERIHSLYIFDYLHVLACLCLDGMNGSETPPTKRGEFLPDAALGMSLSVYARSKFTDFLGVHTCLERLLGVRRLEDDLEEVDRWYGSTIKVSETGSTTLTARVGNILNHPALQRLKEERQLGMLDSVFPTATHTRFQHTLGSYHAATLYLAALYYDPENPLFRALIDIEKCKALLVAVLVHDIGQTAYGHELEEVDDQAFSHRIYVEVVLDSKSFVDGRGQTLKQLIEGSGDACWNLRLEQVLALFHKPDASAAPFEGVLHDILDSQIDADKFDYLVRDSVEARVTYGHGIDLDRFLRSLTTYAKPDGTLRLAVKQKGAASAEAFALARYQLYQSMYWHHTFRATKAMLLEAIHKIEIEVQALGGEGLLDRYPLRTAYIRRVIGAKDYSPVGVAKSARGRRAKETPLDARLNRSIGDLPLRYRNDEFMILLLKLSQDAKTTGLIHDLINRNYYKRVLEVSPAKLSIPGWEQFRDRFRKDRSKIQEEVEKKLLDKLRSRVQSVAAARESLQVDTALEQINAIANQKMVFLVDVPLRGWFAVNLLRIDGHL
jgi:serine/threonine protein kinase